MHSLLEDLIEQAAIMARFLLLGSITLLVMLFTPSKKRRSALALLVWLAAGCGIYLTIQTMKLSEGAAFAGGIATMIVGPAVIAFAEGATIAELIDMWKKWRAKG